MYRLTLSLIHSDKLILQYDIILITAHKTQHKTNVQKNKQHPKNSLTYYTQPHIDVHILLDFLTYPVKKTAI